MRKATSLKINTYNFKGCPLYLLMDIAYKRRSETANAQIDMAHLWELLVFWERIHLPI